MSVLPSRAFIVTGVGGRQPVASRREMSAFSSVCTMRPPMSRSTVTGGVSGVEYVSTKYRPSGDIVTTWFAFSGVSSVCPLPSKPMR